MRNTLERIKRHSKKGTTLVELVVAMTLTLIFAVACVALINPIERTYQNVEKMSRAQLLADTIIDSIRKECDDVQYDDPNAVWLVAAGNSADDDQMLFAVPSSKPASGNVLVIKKDNKYCEAIYSCFPISAQNISNLTANPADGSTSAHAASTLTGDNLNRGLVHFGYYQGKYSKDGLYPFKAYDYTNPVTASTYGDYTVALLFERVGCKTINGVEYPAFVECTVKVYKGDYNNGGEFIYSRTAAVCFSANGSAQGSAGNIDTSSTTHVRDYNVVIEWDDGNAADRPASVVVKLCDDLNDLDPSNDVVLRTHTLDTTKTRFVFADVKTTGKAYIIVPDFPGYTTLGPISRSDGFYVKYQRSDSAKLIRGIELRNKMSTAVTNVIFGLKSDPVLAAAVQNASHSEPVALNGDELSDRYMLYIVNGTDDDGNPKKTAYILSDDPEIVLNEDSSQMFYQCSKLKQITGLEMLDTSHVVDMHRMFRDCKKLSQDFILTNWDTSNVQAFDSMFYNVGTDVPDDTRMTIDVSSFDFRSARDYGTGSDGMPVVGINKMFWADGGLTSHIETIIFPTDSEMKKMVDIPRMQNVFSGCDLLVNLENFNNLDLSGLHQDGEYNGLDNVFTGCRSLKELDISNWNCPGITSYKAPLDGLSNLEKLNMSGLNLSGCTSLDSFFDGAKNLKELDLSGSNFSSVESFANLFNKKTNLISVDLNGCDASSLTSVAFMFYNCSNLKSVDMAGVVGSSCTSMESVFDSCKNLNELDISGWNTSGITNMANAFKLCHTSTADNFVINISDFNFGEVTNLNGLFNGSGVTKIIFPGNSNFAKAQDIGGMFQNCKGLTTIEGFSSVSFPLIEDASHMFGGCSSLTNVDFDIKLGNAKNIDYMFSNCTSLGSVDLTMDYPEATSAKGLFYNCSGLTNATLDMDFDVVTDIGGMFNGCKSLAIIDLDIYAPEVKSIEGLFSGCKELTSLNFDADLGSVENISYLFNDCAKLETVSLGMDFQNVKQADYLFNGCSSLKSIDSFDFNMPNVESLNNLFSGCSSLTSVTLDLDLQKATAINNMFMNCTALKTVDISLNLPLVKNIDNIFNGCKSLTTVTAELDLPLVTKLNKVFNECSALESVDLSNSDFSGCTTVSTFYYKCDSLKSITMNDVSLSSCTNFNDMFSNCPSLTDVSLQRIDIPLTKNLSFLARSTIIKLDLTGANLSGVTSLSSWSNNMKSLQEISFKGADLSACTTTSQMFNSRTSLTKVDFSDVEMPSCTSTAQMFSNCSKLTTINMDGFIAHNNQSCNSMFYNCYNVETIKLSRWDTSSVTNMYRMFCNCGYDPNNKVTQASVVLDVSSFDFSNVTTFEEMFNCDNTQNDKIVRIILPTGDRAVVKAGSVTTKRMFRQRRNLLYIDNIGDFTIQNSISNVTSMFAGSGVRVIDISGIDLSKVTKNNANWIFNNCSNLETIYVKQGTVYDNLAIKGDLLFQIETGKGYTTPPLVGGSGTAWSDAHTKGDYARVDDPANGRPGYFTEKDAV